MVRPAFWSVALALLAVSGLATAKWETVTLVLEEPDGTTEQVEGTKISYGYYVRDFTPKGVKDKLRISRHLAFPERDVRFPDLTRIEFRYVVDSKADVKVPTVMEITYQEKRGVVQKEERQVANLRGFGHPRSMVLILTTPEGDVQFDLLPSHEEEKRQGYRPITEVIFE